VVPGQLQREGGGLDCRLKLIGHIDAILGALGPSGSGIAIALKQCRGVGQQVRDERNELHLLHHWLTIFAMLRAGGRQCWGARATSAAGLAHILGILFAHSCGCPARAELIIVLDNGGQLASDVAGPSLTHEADLGPRTEIGRRVGDQTRHCRGALRASQQRLTHLCLPAPHSVQLLLAPMPSLPSLL